MGLTLRPTGLTVRHSGVIWKFQEEVIDRFKVIDEEQLHKIYHFLHNLIKTI